MIPTNNYYPFAYYKNKVYLFTRSDETESSYFGGPSEHHQGDVAEPAELHHVATFSSRIFFDTYGDICLYYGITYEGCELSYKTDGFQLELESIDPEEASPCWPYECYPRLLPYIPLKLKKTISTSFEEFDEEVMQGLDSSAKDSLVIVVPPNPTMGMSLWGVSGDAEEVQIVFIVDPETLKITACNACT